MSATKITLAAAAIIAIAGIGSLPNPAEAGAYNERLNVCSWYKSRAMSHGRQGNYGEADHFWYLFRQCMKDRID